MNLFGRRKITSEFKTDDLVNTNNIIKLLNDTLSVHLQNKSEIDWLMNYKNGLQPILKKEKIVRPEVNNKLVLNHAQMVTRIVIGYFLGTPIQYIQRGGDKKKQIDELNKYLAYEDKSSVDKEIGEFQSITGTAYRIIFTDGAFGDEVPFEQKALNPSTTYVVYENTIAEKPLCAVTYHTITTKTNNKACKIYVYTEFGVYIIVTSNGLNVNTKTTVTLSETYNMGGVPIIEYPNNMWRIGDWELCIALMDAINSLHSGRLDDIDQIIQSLLVFINAEMDKERYAEMREAGVVMLTSKGSMGAGGADVKTIDNVLDQTGMNLIAKEFESLFYALIGIPDRENRAGGGGDTGAAVELRDGWADLETVVRNKELSFRRSEKQSLKIMLSILKNKLGFDLSMLDIDVKFSRNKTNNLLVKTQSYQTLLATKTISPADALLIVDLVSDVEAFIERGTAFWGEDFAGIATSQSTLKSQSDQNNENDQIESSDDQIKQEEIKE